MDFMELAKARYSVRKYDARPVEREKLDYILKAGSMALGTGSMNLEVGCSRLPEPLRVPYAAYMAASGRHLIELFEKA